MRLFRIVPCIPRFYFKSMIIIFWISPCKGTIWCRRSSNKNMGRQINFSWRLFNSIGRRFLLIFAKKLPYQNARQIKNISHKVLWFRYSARSKVKQLAKTVKSTPKIYSVRTTSLNGIIQVRNRYCFCILCKNNLECLTNESREKIVSIIYSSW